MTYSCERAGELEACALAEWPERSKNHRVSHTGNCVQALSKGIDSSIGLFVLVSHVGGSRFYLLGVFVMSS